MIPFIKEGSFALETLSAGAGWEGEFAVGPFKSFQFYQMSRQCIIYGLNFKAYAMVSL